MKKLALLAVLAFSVCNTKAQVANLDTMIYKMFATLKAKDANAYIGNFPTGQQLTRILQNISEPQKAALKAKVEKILKADEKTKNYNVDSLLRVEYYEQYSEAKMTKIKANLRISFQQIIETGESEGAIWRTVEIKAYAIDSADTNAEAIKQQLTSIRTLRGSVDFTSAGKLFKLFFEQLIYLPDEGGWFGGQIMNLIRTDKNIKNQGLPMLEVPSMKTKSSSVKPKSKRKQ